MNYQRLRSTILFVLVAIFSNGVIGFADIIGKIETNVVLLPQSNSTEISMVEFDIRNVINVTAVMSGLSSTVHSHFGIAGVEDIAIGISGSFGSMDLNTQAIFGRFQGVIPFYNNLHFIVLLSEFDLNFGGIRINNLMQFSDTALFISQTPAYAFGDRILVNGQTPSGVGVTIETGICLTQDSLNIKNHQSSLIENNPISTLKVNPDCATSPKPDVLFDFERITITGLNITPDVFMNSIVTCVQVNPCGLEARVFVSNLGAPVPRILVVLSIENLLEASQSTILLQLISNSNILGISFLPTGVISNISLFISGTINPEVNPATFSTLINISPISGLTSGLFGLRIERQNLVFAIDIFFNNFLLPITTISSVRPTLTLTSPTGLFGLMFRADFDLSALDFAEATLSINF